MNTSGSGQEYISINIDNTQAKDKAKETADSFSNIGKSAEQAGKQMDNAVERLGKQAAAQSRYIEELNNQYSEQKKRIAELDRQIISHKELQELNRKEVEELNKQYKQAKETQGEWAANTKYIKAQLNDAREGYKMETDAIKALNLEKQKAAQQAKDLQSESKRESDSLKDTTRQIKQAKEEAAKIPSVNEQIANSMKTVAKLSAGYLSVKQAKAFLDTATKIRGELELTQTQLQGLFGGQGGAQIFSGAKDIAMKSGLYSTAGLTQAAETLNIYGEQTENIIPMLREFGDVAMGNEQKLNSLATAFGRVQMEGKLSSLTLRTMVNAGFNPLNEIARTTGQSMDSLRQKMRNGEITITQVRDAFKTATAEGGKYYGMTEKLGSGIKAEQERLQLMIKQVYAKWGEQHESLILSSIKLKQWVVQNIGEIAKWLGVLIGTYGTYKTAVITLNAVEAIQAAGYVRKIRLLRLMAVAQAALNAVMMMNPYVLAATALGALTATVIAFTKKSTVAADATEAWNRREQEMAEAHQKRKDKMNALLQKIKDETTSEYERQGALQELQRILPSVFKKFKKWADLQTNIAQATAAANEELQKQNIIEGGNARYGKDSQLLKDLKQYREAISKSRNASEKERTKILLIKRHPYLFTNSKSEARQMQANPESYKLMGFKSQGTFESNWHFVNSLIKTTEENITKGLKNTESKLSTIWDAALPQKSIKQINDMAVFYANEIKKIDQDNKQRTRIITKRTATGTTTSEQIIPANSPRDYIEFKNAQGRVVRITRDEAKRRLDTLKREQNAYQFNAGRDFLQEAKNNLKKAQQEQQNIVKNRKSYRTSTAYEQALEQSRRKIEDAEAVVKRRSVDSSLTKSDTKATHNAARLEAEQTKARERMAEEDRRYQLEREKQARENGYNTQQAEIDGMQEGEAKKLQQAKLNHQKQIDELKEQERQLYEQKVQHAKNLWEADPQNKDASFWSAHARNSKTGTVAGITPLTEEETAGITAKRLSEEKRYSKEIQDIMQASIASMNEYIKDYGSFEERRLAIANDFNAKIEQATTQGERYGLQAQLDNALSDLDFEQAKKQINWESVFGNLGTLTLQQLNTVKQQLRAMLNDSSLTIDQYKDAAEQIDKVNTAIINAENKVQSALGLIIPTVEERRRIERDVADATERQRDAMLQSNIIASTLDTQRMMTSRRLGAMGISVGQQDITASMAGELLNKVGSKFGFDSSQYKEIEDALAKVAKSERAVVDANEKAVTVTITLTDAQNRLKIFSEDFNKKLRGVADVVSIVANNLGSLPKLFEQIGIDMTGQFGKGISDIAEAGQQASQAMQDLISGNFVGAAAGGIGAVKSVLSGYNNIFGLGIGKGNVAEVRQLTERLSKSNDALRTSIDGLKDAIKSEHGINTINDTRKALEAQNRINENSRNILEAQMRYQGAHHSNAKKWRMTPGQYSQINQVLTEYTQRHPDAETKVNRVYSLDDILKLTPEQMNEIRTRRADVWTAMLGQGKYDKSEYWEAYADHAGEIEEITKTLREKLTGITFESMHDDFVDKLMDMETKAEDFTKDINRLFAKSLLNFAIGTQLDARMKKWWQSWADTMEKQGGKLTETQIDNMRREYEAYVEEGMQIRETVFNITGFNETGKYNQDSSKSVLEGVTQDQIQELNGRMASVQINLDKIAMQIQADYERNGNQIATMQDIRNIMDDLLDMQYQGIEHLQKIEVYTSELPAIRQDIGRIKKQTARL